jgi:hypothetical protein
MMLGAPQPEIAAVIGGGSRSCFRLLFFCLCLLLRAYLPHNSLLLTHDLICDLNAALHTATRKCN